MGIKNEVCVDISKYEKIKPTYVILINIKSYFGDSQTFLDLKNI